MKIVRALLNDHLFGNSLWLIANSMAMTGLGFFFWMINTRLYTPEQIGVATVLLSAAELIAVLSLLGFDIALIKYLPRLKTAQSQTRLINSSFWLCGLAALLLSVVFVLPLGKLIHKDALVLGGFISILFIFFAMTNIIFILIESVCVARRRSRYIFIKNMFFSAIKIILCIALVSFGTFGIFGSWMAAMVVSVFVGLLLLRLKPRFELNKGAVKKMFRFSFINYISKSLAMAPSCLLPVMITAKLGPEMTAYFYMDWMIAISLFMIPYSVAQTLLAESSRKASDLREKTRKALIFSYVLLIPAVLVVIIFSKYLLLLFGKQYSDNAFLLLKVLAASSLFYAINITYIAIKNIEHEPKKALGVNLFVATTTLGFSYLFIEEGIVAIGLVWLSIQAAVALRNAWLLRWSKHA